MDFSTDLLTYLLTYSLTYLLTNLLTHLLFYWLTDLLTYLLTYSLTHSLTHLLIPSDKHNLITARARDLISSLINIASSRDMPFHQPQQLHCLHNGPIFVPLCAPILSSQLHIGDDHLMASVWGIKIADTLFILLLTYSVMKQVGHC